MASRQDLEEALLAAHNAGNTADAQRLAAALYSVKQREPKGRGVGQPSMGGQGPFQMLKEGAPAALIGAGRTMDKIAQGNRQLGLSAVVAGKEALRMDSREQLDSLAQQEKFEREQDEAYAPLQREHPFATKLGENSLLGVTPMGQATALGRIGVPMAVSAAEGALEYGSPQERSLKGLGQGVAGGVGGVAGEVSRLLINPVRNVMGSSAQEAAQSAAAKIKAPLLPSQQTGSESLARVEDMLGRYPGSAGVMREYTQKGKDAVRAKAGEAIGEPTIEPGTLGVAKSRMGEKYTEMRGQISGMPAHSEVFDSIDKARKMLTTGSTKGKEGALGMLEELKDKLYNTKQLSPEEYQGWVTDLAAAARETQNLTIKTALKTVGREMDKVARGPLAKEWGELDKQYGNLKTLMKPGVVNDATGEVHQGRLANTLERQLGESLKTGKAEGPLVDIYNYTRAVPQLRQGSQTAEREAASNPWQWLLAAPRYGAAKAMTSDAGRGYLAKGLLGSPEASKIAALLAQSGSVPLTMAPSALWLQDLLGQ